MLPQIYSPKVHNFSLQPRWLQGSTQMDLSSWCPVIFFYYYFFYYRET